MNLLLVAPQAGGGSIVSALLGQNPESVVIPDFYATGGSKANLPPVIPKMHRLALRLTVHGHEPLSNYVPQAAKLISADRIMYVIRNPYCWFVSLRSKRWAGEYENKLSLLSHHVKSVDPEDVIFYEDLVFRPRTIMAQLSFWPVDLRDFTLRRDMGNILTMVRQNIEWFGKNKGWGGGEARLGRGINSCPLFKAILPMDKRRVVELAPDLLALYFKARPEYAAMSVDRTEF